jgi:hypothetical protein
LGRELGESGNVGKQDAGKQTKTQKLKFHFFKSIGTCDQVSISPTFYEQLLRQNPFAKKLQTQIVST